MEWAALIAILCVLLSVKYVLGRLRIHGYQNRCVLVTGCDTGFGNLLAKRLDGMGIRVVAGCLTDDGVTALNRVCSDFLVAIKLDITKAADIENALRQVKEFLPPKTGLWALVNNAGIGGTLGMLDWLEKGDFEKVMEVNLYGPIEMTRTFLPLLRMSCGRIVTVTSLVGRLALGLPLPYAVSKFALEGYLDGIRVQLYSSNVSVHIVEPGNHDTGMAKRLLDTVEPRFRNTSPAIQEFYGHEFVTKVIAGNESMAKYVASPENVVDAYVHAITARFPRYRYVVGWDAALLWPLTLLPERVGDFVVNLALPVPKALSRTV